MEDMSEAALVRLESRRSRVNDIITQLRELLEAIDTDIIAVRLQRDADRVSPSESQYKDSYKSIDTIEE